MNIHLRQENVQFSLFTSEEIKRMSVCQIVTPLTLDALGHPIPGGLYDRRLGPLSDDADACGTCAKTIANCPGHFGYIELPLPVVNPLFHKIIGTLMKISCLHCHHIQIPIHIKRILVIQLKLLNCGLLTDSMEAEQLMMELISTHQSYEKIPEESIQPVLKYEKLADEMIGVLKGNILSTQNVETLRNQFIYKTLRDVKARKTCMFCKRHIDRIQALKNKIILSARKLDKGADKTITIKGVESKYVNPEESR
ncbi:unnamed protein product [Acanthoscelides obtectus]|nr:unnamed protein product [Acanthoscelides obtectus]CAK1664048.1 DNA-directed RNA polymerase I subunit RPA1 [Acanthoscelides obtectus]